MGSFNVRCNASGLPIFHGDSVVGIPIIQSIENHEKYVGSVNCYPTDICAPCCLPIFGKYDSYGNVENFKTHWFHGVLLNLANNVSKPSIYFKAAFVGENHLIGTDTLNQVSKNIKNKVEPVIPDFESLLDVCVGGGGLTINNRGIGLSFVRKDVWDGFIELSNTELHWRTNRPILENLESDFDLYKKFVLESDGFKSFPRGGNTYSTHITHHVLFDNLLEEISFFLAENKLNDEQWDIFKKTACDFIRFSVIFSRAGKWWHPQGGGDQNTDIDLEWKLHELQGNVLKGMQKQIDLDRAEYEDEVCEKEDENESN